MLKQKSLRKKTSYQDLTDSVQSYLRKHSLTNKKFAVACSAGVDSLLLLEIISNFKIPELYCFHLDHSLREDSHEAVDFLEKFCKERKIKLVSKKLARGEIKADENTARKARYKFFSEAAKKHQINDILLAHNLSDQAETVLFRLIRGTATYGLSGIAMQRLIDENLKIHRPLLEICKEKIIETAKEIDLDFIEDSSNASTNYARNRIRLEILPQAKKINQKTEENINKLSQIISEEQELFSKLITATEEKLSSLAEGWSLIEFRDLDRALQRKLLEKNFTTNIDFCNDFLAAIEKGGFHKINFAKGKFFTIRQKKIRLEECSQ